MIGNNDSNHSKKENTNTNFKSLLTIKRSIFINLNLFELIADFQDNEGILIVLKNKNNFDEYLCRIPPDFSSKINNSKLISFFGCNFKILMMDSIYNELFSVIEVSDKEYLLKILQIFIILDILKSTNFY